MTLRIQRPITVEGVDASGGTSGDDWGARIAKLIPAEALGLYGTAVAFGKSTNQTVETLVLWIIVAVCCGLTVLIRYRATLDPVTHRPAWTAIAIALVSFILWVWALGPPNSPIPVVSDLPTAGPLAALLWGTILPYIYRGE